MRLPALLFFMTSFVWAQSPQVPAKMSFAGMTLIIRDDARKEIQKDVDALTQYPKYFNIKVERARTYFPIIEKIFTEERLPDDFKYLVLQESALISDAVSSSNAVGFWQFKDFTAMEMGLRVDKEIDERMNISSSTRAAARYLKKNNFYFNNWLYALQAYQMGAGGVMRSVSDVESGASQMEITAKTYWYVKKFLAHKVAFESAVQGPAFTTIIPFEAQQSKSLKELAAEFAVPVEQLTEYNKWAKTGIIPADRKYVVSIPTEGDGRNIYALVDKAGEQVMSTAENFRQHRKPEPNPAVVTSAIDKKYIQGIPAVKAEPNESPSGFASRAGIGLSYFLACNDITVSETLQGGQYYYIKKKRNKTSTKQHTVSGKDESLWSISQQYAVNLKRVKKLNPTVSTKKLKEGTVVMLPTGLIKSAEPVVATMEVAELEKSDFFSWSIEPSQQVVSTSSETVLTTSTSTLSRQSESGVVQLEKTIVVTSVAADQAEKQSASSTITVPQQTEPVVAGSDQHVVLAGETLYALANRYNVSVMDLVNWNQLSLQDGIKTGQVLNVKDPAISEKDEVLPVIREAQTPEESIVYIVQPNDTLYSVARQYGVTIKDLMDWNKKKDFNVAVGEKLRIQQK
jgi:membrane-bound lytic murein transglycosylase D